MSAESTHESIDHALARLEDVSGAGLSNAPWQKSVAAARAAAGDPDWESRTKLIVEALQQVRDAGALDRVEAQILIAGTIVALAEHRATDAPVPQMQAIVQRMHEIERESGLAEDDYWAEDAHVPDEWRALSSQYEEIWDGILAATFNQFGEAELGVSYLSNAGRDDDPYGPVRRRRGGD